ncbi:MAG: hypothetical protein SGPRY_001954, partial [Prymnesium sp.]
MKPADVNNVSDDVLFEHVNAAKASLDGAANVKAVEAAPVSQFFTLQLLHRVYDEIAVQLRRSGVCKLAKHKVLAASVIQMTGVAIPQDVRDIDKIENRLDIWLRKVYVDDDGRLVCQMKAGIARERAREELYLERERERARHAKRRSEEMTLQANAEKKNATILQKEN